MTMHLIQGISTLNTRKPQFKLTKAKEASWRDDLAVYNREMRRQGQPRLTWEQYVDMRLGKTKVEKPRFQPLSTGTLHPRYQDRVVHPSLNTHEGQCFKRESMKYNGERKLLGVGVLHKSCLQPIWSQQEAEEIAKMRRG